MPLLHSSRSHTSFTSMGSCACGGNQPEQVPRLNVDAYRSLALSEEDDERLGASQVQISTDRSRFDVATGTYTPVVPF
jgi:hypothetical protein